MYLTKKRRQNNLNNNVLQNNFIMIGLQPNFHVCYFQLNRNYNYNFLFVR